MINHEKKSKGQIRLDSILVKTCKQTKTGIKGRSSESVETKSMQEGAIEDLSTSFRRNEVMGKITKHLQAKTEKCVDLLIQLLDSQKVELSGIESLDILVRLLSSNWGLNYALSQKVIKLFNYCSDKLRLALSAKEQESSNQVITLFKIAFLLRSKFITDDQFSFSKYSKEVEESILNLPLYSQENEEIAMLNFKEAISNSLYNPEEVSNINLSESQLNSDEFKLYRELLDGNAFTSRYLTRVSLVECIKQMHKKISCMWASSIIKQVLRIAIINKDKFSTQQIDEIFPLVNSSSANTSISGSKSSLLLDQKIKSSPLDSYFPISDSRELKLVDNTNKWNLKQSGQTFNKLSFS